MSSALAIFSKVSNVGETCPVSIFQIVFLLTQTYVRFGMLLTALVAIKEQESENLSLVLSNLLDEYIKRVDVICKQLNSILEPIANELNVTIS